ncbi:MAG: threonine/serine exporter family protein [Odoribacter splanchnicus]
MFLYRFPDCRTRSILQFRDHPRYRTRYQRPVSDSGVPLINSILDILEGHVLVGLSRTINATILIICIALGLSMTLLILGKDIL